MLVHLVCSMFVAPTTLILVRFRYTRPHYAVYITAITKLKCEQVDLRALSLNANDVFVVESAQNLWVWVGKSAAAAEKSMGEVTAKMISKKTPIVVEEEKEPTEFWQVLGGKKPYVTEEEKVCFSPLLHACTYGITTFGIRTLFNTKFEP